MGIDLVNRARDLADDKLSGSPQRWVHVQTVAQVADSTARQLGLHRADEVVASAWLHDIGYAADVASSGFHPLDGARYARKAGFPELVVSLIAFHTGAEFEAEQRGLLEEFDEFVRPDREMLDVVTYADMTTSPAGVRVDAPDRVSEILKRYELHTPVHDAVERSAPALLAAVDRVSSRLRAVA